MKQITNGVDSSSAGKKKKKGGRKGVVFGGKSQGILSVSPQLKGVKNSCDGKKVCRGLKGLVTRRTIRKIS